MFHFSFFFCRLRKEPRIYHFYTGSALNFWFNLTSNSKRGSPSFLVALPEAGPFRSSHWLRTPCWRSHQGADSWRPDSLLTGVPLPSCLSVLGSIGCVCKSSLSTQTGRTRPVVKVTGRGLLSIKLKASMSFKWFSNQHLNCIFGTK